VYKVILHVIHMPGTGLYLLIQKHEADEAITNFNPESEFSFYLQGVQP